MSAAEELRAALKSYDEADAHDNVVRDTFADLVAKNLEAILDELAAMKGEVADTIQYMNDHANQAQSMEGRAVDAEAELSDLKATGRAYMEKVDGLLSAYDRNFASEPELAAFRAKLGEGE